MIKINPIQKHEIFFKDDFMFTITNKYLINLLHSIENITGKIQTLI